MASKQQTKDATRELAEKIARELFTCFAKTSTPVHCDQIWLYVGERRQAGWSERGMADAIENILREQIK